MTNTTRRTFLFQTAATATGICMSPRFLSAADSAPHFQFPSAPQERLSVASYPFRKFLAGFGEAAKDAANPQMELKDFAAHVAATFGVNKIEPWSWHFRSLEKKYLEEIRAAVDKAGAGVANLAVDSQHSVYSADRVEREKAVEVGKNWIDAAVTLGSPSIRMHIDKAKDRQPDVDSAAETLRRVAEHGAARNVVVHLENDDPISEDVFFVVKVLEKANTPWLRALPDFANSIAAGQGESAYEGIRKMFAHAYGISHVKEIESDDNGKIFRADLPRTFGILKASGYKGYCSMEWDSPGDPYEGTKGLIQQTLKYLA